MEEGRKKIWLWLAVMMLTAMQVGGCYYFGTVKETSGGQQGTLVENTAGEELYGC